MKPLLLLFIPLLVACQTKKITTSPDDVARQQLGINFDRWPNELNTMTLYLQKNDNPSRVTRGLVLDNTTNEILYQFSFMAGHAKWVDNVNLEVFDAPEVMKEGDDMLKHTKKIDINSFKRPYE